jgi:uncharacterized repeat protein (TIGR01451 family)
MMGRLRDLVGQHRWVLRHRWRAVVLFVSLSCGLVFVGAAPAFAASITSSGPLTRVEVSPDLNCAVDHAGDTSPEFFGDTACGTLIVVDGVLFGPASIPAGGSAFPRTPYTAVSQSAVTGSGTIADPYMIVTVVDLGTTGMRITETDSYIVGQESYRTDVTVANAGAQTKTALLYRAGDCYLQNSDLGFGSVDTSTGAVACVAGTVDNQGNTVPGTRIEQWSPLSPGSHFYEEFYDTVWARIGSQQPFPDLCAQCANYIDNGAGLSWELTIPSGGSVTRSHLTNFSPLGRVPLTATKTADVATAAAGSTDGYTITISNPNTVAVSLSSITDTLPAGFTYGAGSTTGATTTDPSILGPALTWTGPISVPASSSSSLHFSVTVASTPGDYFNSASADGGSFTVAPTGETAKITVTGALVHTMLTKTASPTSGVAPLTVTYSYNETNDGTEPLGSVALIDDMCSPVTRGPDSPGNNDATLAPGETWTFTCTHTFTTGGTFTNTATATGNTTTGAPAPAEHASATVTVTQVHTTLTKTASPTSGVAPLTVTYSYNETNDGTEPLGSVALADDMCSPVTRGPDSPGNNDATLAPGETWTFTCTHTFTTGGTFTNTATATGNTTTGAPAPAEHASATVTVTVTSAVQPLSPGYWKNHEAATTALLPQTLGSFTVGDFATATGVFASMNCSDSSKSTQNAVGCLAGQLLATKLNVANGTSTCIAPTIAAADAFLVSVGYTGPTGTYTLTADQRATAISLKSTLDAYNNTGVCT